MVRRIIATEAIALGVLATSVGTGLALLAAWATVVLVFELPFDPPLLDLLGLALATFCVTAIFGGVGVTTGAVESPQAALRRTSPQ